MQGWELARSFAKPRADRRLAAVAPVAIRARYDAAQTPAGDAKHWANADSLSADAAHGPGVRKILRERSRYEEGNNGLCNRMVKTKSVDLIGTGPRVQMIGPNKAANEWLENLWVRWSRKSRFARALRTACKAKVRDGEAIAILARNLKLPTPAKFSLRMLECERLRQERGRVALQFDHVHGLVVGPVFVPQGRIGRIEHRGKRGRGLARVQGRILEAAIRRNPTHYRRASR